jgi:biotin transport system substrate-specific component
METFPSKNIAISWVEKGSLTRNLFLSLGFAIVTALSAQIRFVIPISPVPITGQTFVVLLAGLVLGSTFGAVSMLMYLFIGMSGLPFFSAGVAGLAILKSPTIGYIIGFFLAANVIGRFANKPILGIALGSVLIYICGVVGLMLILNVTVSNAITIGVVPFIIGDVIKSIMAIGVAYKLK